MRSVITLLALCSTMLGAELSTGKSPRVEEIEKKFHLTYQKMASADDDVWWVFMQTPITPVVVHVDAPDSEVSAAIETSDTSARLFRDVLLNAAKGKKK